MDYQNWKQFVKAVRFAAEAHQKHTLPDAKAMRTFPSGEQNPYYTHSLWCAMMLLLETKLPAAIREPGAYALLWHDILEDTTQDLPEETPGEVRNLVDEMTYIDDATNEWENAWEEERTVAPTRPPVSQLLKLYDKVAALYDSDTPAGKKLDEWIELTKTLRDNVEQEYGKLNIVLLARALIDQYENSV